MDNLKKVRQDRKKINPEERWERSYWSKKLGVSGEKLRELVKRFGNSASKIRKS